MNLIYLCHEYGGKQENIDKVQAIAKQLQTNSQNVLYVVPHLAIGHIYHSIPYEDGMRLCLAMLEKCDAMITFGEHSKSRGCLLEKQYCGDNGISIIDLGGLR